MFEEKVFILEGSHYVVTFLQCSILANLRANGTTPMFEGLMAAMKEIIQNGKASICP